ncbi:DUF2157 domain-containing protein [Mucilaginibacter terrae]|uniref:DUF2157 domain-containing protein n=1 Tax=Mucilaginibacter terrae TaxID=1955052 RepID=A0ABU3GRW6_9SPHI|nr:DUF2157 domain-containing protein [Mucilaginibacter terrae]MDT3402525.1 hypothetical protein [Mucilaginibacter terrae]
MLTDQHHLYDELHAQGIISDASYTKINQQRLNPLFSVHWEVKTILYLGIMLFTGGIGTLVYKNIDTIGHQIILAFIALVSGGCLFYCFKNKKPFSRSKVESPNTFFDYVLLLGTISLLIFIGYLQYQYNVFGNNYGLATLIPMLILFYLAYDFDHIGILNMAIANLGIWMGVTATPRQLLQAGIFMNGQVIFTYVGFGLLLLLAAWLTQKFIFKKHFKFSYAHYGIHVTLIALLAGYFHYYDEGHAVLWAFAVLGLTALIYKDAYQQKSFYFIMLAIVYGYITVSCLLFMLLTMGANDAGIILSIYYVPISAAVVIYSLNRLHKKLKAL